MVPWLTVHEGAARESPGKHRGSAMPKIVHLLGMAPQGTVPNMPPKTHLLKSPSKQERVSVPAGGQIATCGAVFTVARQQRARNLKMCERYVCVDI